MPLQPSMEAAQFVFKTLRPGNIISREILSRLLTEAMGQIYSSSQFIPEECPPADLPLDWLTFDNWCYRFYDSVAEVEVDSVIPLSYKHLLQVYDKWRDAVGIARSVRSVETEENVPGPKLSERKQEKLYCVCQRPNRLTDFFIQCDLCDEYFHGRCVRVVESEAEGIDFACPKCKRNFLLEQDEALTVANYDRLYLVITVIMARKDSWPFRVLPEDKSDYYNVIKEPIGKWSFVIIVHRCHITLYSYLSVQKKINIISNPFRLEKN